MKILFIAGQAIKSNSSVSMMNIAYIKGLLEVGNQVKVITSKLPNEHIATDNGFKLPPEIEIEEFKISGSYAALSSKKNKANNIIISKLKKLARTTYHSFSIYGSQKSWINNVYKYSDDEYYDVIISSSDPKHSHLFAKKLIEEKRIQYRKWVQLWGDPMYLDITKKNILFNKRLYKEEENLLSAADKIIYVSPFTAEKQKEIFPKFESKIEYILIPYLFKDNSHVTNKIGKDMTFGYFGDYHSKVRNLMPMYNAAYKTDTKLIVRGNSDKLLDSKGKIDVDRRIPIEKLKKIESNTDVFIHLCNLKGTQIPAKVYYYSGTKKPILFILDGEKKRIKNFFEKYDRYVFCENKEEEIVKAIEKLKNGNYDKKKARILEELSPASIAKELMCKIGGEKIG